MRRVLLNESATYKMNWNDIICTIYRLHKGFRVRLFLNDKLFKVFGIEHLGNYFELHKAVAYDIKEVLRVVDDGTFIDVFCNTFD